MSEYTKELDYAGCLDKAFDGGVLERELPHCPCGPVTIRGKFRGRRVTMYSCAGGGVLLSGRGRSKANTNNLAAQIEAESVRKVEERGTITRTAHVSSAANARVESVLQEAKEFEEESRGAGVLVKSDYGVGP